jgi:sporulation protein YlmC with PRC-barrel domain
MISRSILAAVLAIGTGTAALAEVQVKAPGVDVKAPGIDLNIDVGSKAKPTDAWIGRPVYSADGKHLGEVAAIASDQVYADIGGFLGLGETRVLLDDDSIQAVTDDRVVLKLPEAEAKTLPAVDKDATAPK